MTAPTTRRAFLTTGAAAAGVLLPGAAAYACEQRRDEEQAGLFDEFEFVSQLAETPGEWQDDLKTIYRRRS